MPKLKRPASLAMNLFYLRFSSEALRQSILKKAFSGQLVPQDPNDEPASEMLKRIAAEKAETEAQKKPAINSIKTKRA